MRILKFKGRSRKLSRMRKSVDSLIFFVASLNKERMLSMSGTMRRSRRKDTSWGYSPGLENSFRRLNLHEVPDCCQPWTSLNKHVQFQRVKLRRPLPVSWQVNLVMKCKNHQNQEKLNRTKHTKR
jgi:hypothetical protein